MVADDGIHQLDPRPFTYDATYCAIYDTPEYRHGSEVLNGMRLSFAQGVHGYKIGSILDFGCGNYDFLKQAAKIIPNCYGYDVSGVFAPVFATKVIDISTKVDVVTFHDSLEHCEKPDAVIRSLQCDTIVISLPYCHYRTKGPEWFWERYPHLKPDEHLHHFDQVTLGVFMKRLGWKAVAVSNHEDLVRSRAIEWNILTMGFKRV